MGHSHDVEVLKRKLKRAIHEMRHEALMNGEFEGWHVSHLIRDAATVEQLLEAERRLAHWWRTRH